MSYDKLLYEAYGYSMDEPINEAKKERSPWSIQIGTTSVNPQVLILALAKYHVNKKHIFKNLPQFLRYDIISQSRPYNTNPEKVDTGALISSVRHKGREVALKDLPLNVRRSVKKIRDALNDPNSQLAKDEARSAARKEADSRASSKAAIEYSARRDKEDARIIKANKAANTEANYKANWDANYSAYLPKDSKGRPKGRPKGGPKGPGRPKGRGGLF